MTQADRLLSAPRQWLDSDPTRWFVIFCRADRRHWWDRLLRTPPGFEHVYAVRWDGWNWLVVNPYVAFTDVAIAAVASQNALDQLVEPGATVLEVEAFRRRDRIRGRWWIGPMTCVEQIKALLGIDVGMIFTPWQLYRYLTECTHETTAHARPDRPGSGDRAPPAIRARHVDPRGKRAPQGDLAGPAGTAHAARLGL